MASSSPSFRPNVAMNNAPARLRAMSVSASRTLRRATLRQARRYEIRDWRYEGTNDRLSCVAYFVSPIWDRASRMVRLPAVRTGPSAANSGMRPAPINCTTIVCQGRPNEGMS